MENKDLFEGVSKKGYSIVLGIESSCDETAAAVVKGGRELLSNEVYSQIDVHALYGGVVPEIASRAHVEKIDAVVSEALKNAKVSYEDIDAVAVTFGPGLVGALLVGLSYAKGLSYAIKKPLIGVNHIEGHICANYLCHKELEPPFMGLVASGGHSHIFHVDENDSYSLIGSTQDDAAGEAFDKAARLLGLNYPGGPSLDRLAEKGNDSFIALPKPQTRGAYDFSFSGLKTAFINLHHKNPPKTEDERAGFAASFRRAVVESLVEKTMQALSDRNMKKLVLAGGVSANSLLRRRLLEECQNNGVELFMPSLNLCGDNAAMIAAAAARQLKKERLADLSLNACPSLKLFEN